MQPKDFDMAVAGIDQAAQQVEKSRFSRAVFPMTQRFSPGRTTKVAWSMARVRPKVRDRAVTSMMGLCGEAGVSTCPGLLPIYESVSISG